MEKEIVREFIKIYEKNPCLWDPKHDDYSNRTKRNTSLRLLQTCLEKVSPSTAVTLEEVKKKINNLRSYWKKEYIKVKNSSRQGDGAEESYVPKLFYYDDMLFLADIREQRETRTIEECDETIEDQASSEVTTSTASASGKTKPSHLKRKSSDADQMLATVEEKVIGEDTSEDIFGKYVAASLKKMKPEVALLSQKIISDVLFQGQFAALNQRS